MKTTYLTEKEMILTETTVTAVSVGTSSEYILFTVDDYSGFSVGDFIIPSNLVGAGWSDLNGVPLRITLLITGSRPMAITNQDISSFSAYGSPVNGEKIKIAAGVIRQKDFIVTYFDKDDTTEAYLGVDNILGIGVGDIFTLSDVGGITGLDGVHCSVSYLMSNSNIGIRGDFSGVSGVYTTGGTGTFPYGGRLSLLNDTAAIGGRMVKSPIVQSEFERQNGRVILDYDSCPADLTLSIIQGTSSDNNYTFLYPSVESERLAGSIALTEEASRNVVTTENLMIRKTIADYALVDKDIESLGLFVKYDNYDDPSSSDDVYVIWDSIYAMFVMDMVVDEYGRMDVGKINGSTPMTEINVAEAVLENSTFPIKTDANGRLEVAGTLNTLDDITLSDGRVKQ